MPLYLEALLYPRTILPGVGCLGFTLGMIRPSLYGMIEIDESIHHFVYTYISVRKRVTRIPG